MVKISRWSFVAGSIVALAVGNGCSSDESTAPADNKDFVTPSGEFVGHLKPDPRLLAAIDPDTPQVDPVVWVVDDGQVERAQQELSVHLFRIDFNERQPITAEILPYALMTAETREVVIHRGEPSNGFSNSAINQGERCLPIHLCMNPDCPRVAEVENAPLFPHDPAEGRPRCPFCDGRETMIYQTPQHQEMLRFVEQ